MKIDTMKATEKVKERIEEIAEETGYGKVTVIIENKIPVRVISEKSERIDK